MSDISIIAQIRKRQSALDDSCLGVYQETSTIFKEDPLVLACAVKRFSDHNTITHIGLENNSVIQMITDSDRQLAERIRKYYTKKWFWQTLSDVRGMSDFRSRCCYLLENRIRECKEKDTGIYYKLPWFYEEDMHYDEFKKQFKTKESDFTDSKFRSPSTKFKFELTYLKSTQSRQQKRKLERFWFTDGNFLYSIEVLQDNPLIEMFRHMIELNRSLSLESYCRIERIDQMYFYKLYQFNFIKEQNA